MMSNKICRFTAGAVVFLLLLAAGCTPADKEIAKTSVGPEKAVVTKVEPKKTVETKVEPAEQKPTVKLALKFTPGETTTYKLTTQVQKSVLWEGPLPDKPDAFKGGHTGNKIEMAFAQQIKSVGDNGSAAAEITIKGLKYFARVKDNVVLDFDSSREKDRNNPLSNLIGQSYTIEITPWGQVSKVIDISRAQAAVKGGTSAHRVARALLLAGVIKERHTIPALPPGNKSELKKGDNWSSIKSFDFTLMGSKSYEKIYKLKGIKDAGNKQLALVEMYAIPSSEGAKELHKEKGGGFFSKLFDNTEEYTGELKLDLSAGKVENCIEKLKSEWLAVDPAPVQNDKKEPAALRMTALRLYQIERID